MAQKRRNMHTPSESLAERRWRSIEAIGIKVGLIAQYGVPKKREAIIEAVTEDGYVVLRGVKIPVQPGRIWGVREPE